MDWADLTPAPSGLYLLPPSPLFPVSLRRLFIRPGADLAALSRPRRGREGLRFSAYSLPQPTPYPSLPTSLLPLPCRFLRVAAFESGLSHPSAGFCSLSSLPPNAHTLPTAYSHRRRLRYKQAGLRPRFARPGCRPLHRQGKSRYLDPR